MVKILSQAGSSLADVYDVQGSIAGIDTLDTRDLPIVHEMGATVFSERLSGEVVRLGVVGLLQNASFDVILISPPAGIYRVLGVVVVTTPTARILHCQCSVRSVGQAREVPFFVWDSTNDVEAGIRLDDGGVVNRIQLRPSSNLTPTLGISDGQPRRVGEEIVMRGQASAFGAGTVLVTASIFLGLTDVTRLSSRGLPVPGW